MEAIPGQKSVKNGKTAAGGAAIQISISTSPPRRSPSIFSRPPVFAAGRRLPAGFHLRGGLQPLEAPGPEPLDERAELAESILAQPVEAPRPVPPDGDQAGLLENAEVLGDGRGGVAEVRGDLAGGQLAGLREDLEDPPPIRLGDRLERGLHAGKCK